MGIWFPTPDVASGEKILYQATANRLINPVKALGGKLVVTDHRVLFEPNRLDRLTGNKPWAVRSDQIREVISAPGGKDGMLRFGPGGGRRHLVVVADGIDSGVFTVRDPAALQSAVNNLRGNGRR